MKIVIVKLYVYTGEGIVFLEGGGEEVMGNLRSRFLYYSELERELLRLHS